jgi:hypothetical protein
MKKNNLKQSFWVKMFMDENDINEKSIVGFGAFIMMVIAMSVDLITGYTGKQLTINEFIFDGFMIITLGSFGIASVDKYVTLRTKKDSPEPQETEE